MEVGEAKTNIANLESTVKAAQKKQEEAKAEAKKLEKDMAEFDNNKEGKIDELKVRVFIPCLFAIGSWEVVKGAGADLNV
jgi:peptidoglycan hydrolase CwlO-like protein